MADLIQWRVERLGETDSTNAVAADQVRALWRSMPPPPLAHAAQGLAIVAGRQNAGRGQHGRAWESPEGGLYLSAVVEEVPAEARTMLAIIAGVAAARCVAGWTGMEIQLRWPNDLMLRGRKLGGILCESLAQGNRWAGIIGIGINVNTALDALPERVARRATSLIAQDGRRREVQELERRLLDGLGGILQEVNRGGTAVVIAEARRLNCLAGRRVELSDGGQVVRGVVSGLGDNGELLIETGRGIVGRISGTLVAVDGEPLR